MKRIWHPWWLWESVPAGFYGVDDAKIDATYARQQYAKFLRDTPRFIAALDRALAEWPIACEQFLSNESINRVAWLGQASMCIATGIPSSYRGGFNLLPVIEQDEANRVAQRVLDSWIARHA